MKKMKQVTRKELESMGGIIRPPTLFQGQIIDMPDGSVWRERPSDNGNGWYLGGIDDLDNLIFDQVV